MKHIIITAGDPLGIGPEIITKALNKINRQNIKITVIGDFASLKEAGCDDMSNFIEVKTKYKKPIKRGPSKYGGDISFKSFRLAIDMMLAGKADALVTAPISKEAWAMANISFTGHTEVLKKYAAKKGALMMFTSGKINCALVTEHYKIKDLSKGLTKKRIKDAVHIFADILGKEAEIALSALNPHAGDGGKLGEEEIKTITPAISELASEGFNVTGPYPVDSLWQKHTSGKFDGIVCMYHDAALLGLKLAAKKPIVHITAGLKFLRVSPTHGTAFDIAGKNIADANGMLATINYAIKH